MKLSKHAGAPLFGADNRRPRRDLCLCRGWRFRDRRGRERRRSSRAGGEMIEVCFWLAVFYVWLGGTLWFGRNFSSEGFWGDDILYWVGAFVFWPAKIVQVLINKVVLK